MSSVMEAIFPGFTCTSEMQRNRLLLKTLSNIDHYLYWLCIVPVFSNDQSLSWLLLTL